MYLCETENKLTLHCEGNKKGACLGKILFVPELDCKSIAVLKKGSANSDITQSELERYLSALEKAQKERNDLYISLKDECDAAWIFLMHATLLRSSLFCEAARQYISAGKCAEDAVIGVWESFTSALETEEDKENLRSVCLDVKDVCISLLLHLRGARSPIRLEVSESKILFCPSPLPSFIAKNKKRISGLVASPQALQSSSFELLNALSIPALLCEEELSSFCDGEYAIIDSERGILRLSPDLSTLEEFSELEEKKRQREKSLLDISEREVISAEGKRLSLFAEIEKAYEIDLSLPFRCDGIGILSNEELYLQKLCMPDEEVLFERYRRAAELMPTKPVIVRALGFSGETRINSMTSERNGEKRGEVYVFRSTSLKSQLRAAMRAAVYGNIFFLLSPNGSHASIGRCERITEELAQELCEEGREFSMIQIGVQISTPAEALTCKTSVCDADFAVVSTEKLLELLDGRGEPYGEYESTIKNEALAILLGEIVKAKDESGKKFIISLGKKASVQTLKKALSLGFESFSVAASALPETKLLMSELLLN